MDMSNDLWDDLNDPWNNRFCLDDDKNPKNLKELAAHGFAIAKGIIEDGHELQAIFLVLGPQGQFARCPVRWRNDDEKCEVFHKMRHVMRATKVKAYVFISEVWMATVGKDDPDMSIPASQHPDRIEALLVDGNDMEGHGVHMVGEIKTVNGRRVVETTDDIMPDESLGGGNAHNFLLLNQERRQTRH